MAAAFPFMALQPCYYAVTERIGVKSSVYRERQNLPVMLHGAVGVQIQENRL